MVRHRATLKGAASVAAIACLAAHAAGQDYVLVTDASGDKIVRYEYDTGAPVDHFVGKGISRLDNPIYLRVTPDGDVAAVSRETNSVELYDGQSGKWLRTLVASGSGGLNAPKDIAFDHDGNIYVTSTTNNRVLKYNQNGVFDKVLIASGLQEPCGLVVGEDGLLYVASRNNNLVRSYDTATGDRIERLPLENTGIDGPNGLAFGPDGALYIGGRFSNSIVRVPRLGTPSVLVSGSPVLDGPGQLAFDSAGDLVVVSQDTDTIVKFDAGTGAYLGTVVTPAFAGGLDDAVGVAFISVATDPDEPGCSLADLDEDDDVDFDDLDLFVDAYMLGCP